MPTTEEIRDMLREETAELKDGLKRLDYAIRGNGTPGLQQRVGILESAWQTQKKLWGAVLTIICATVTALVAKIIN